MSIIQDDSNKQEPRNFDIIIFGASGCVGSFLVEEMALVMEKHYTNSTQDNANQTDAPISSANTRRTSVPSSLDRALKWAVAGRSAVRLQDTLCKAELSTGIRELAKRIPLILADLQQHKSLLNMCAKTNIIINCVGPYSIEGEALVVACLKSGTNYIDLAHENTFIEHLRRSYHEEALKKGVYILNGCGFQSMSCELGLNYAKKLVDGQIDEVKIILNLSDTKAHVRSTDNQQLETADKQLRGTITNGMWNSLLIDRSARNLDVIYKNSNDNKRELPSIKDDEDDEQLVQSRKHLRKDTQTLVAELMKLKNQNSLINQCVQLLKGFDNYPKSYCLSTGCLTSEESQLFRGEMTAYKVQQPSQVDSSDGCWKPIKSNSFISFKTLSQALLMLLWMFAFDILSKCSLTRRALKSFVSLVTLGHASGELESKQVDRDSLNHIKFSQTFLVYGTPGAESGDPLEERQKHCKRRREQLLVTRIVGPEPNHVATATFACQAALSLLLERDHIASISNGGVLTPGVAFSQTNIIYQLRRRNIKFEVLKKA